MRSDVECTQVDIILTLMRRVAAEYRKCDELEKRGTSELILYLDRMSRITSAGLRT